MAHPSQRGAGLRGLESRRPPPLGARLRSRPSLGLLLLALAAAAPAEAAEGPRRTAWLGLDRGPLAPRRAAEIEAGLRDAIVAYPSVHLVDAAGQPLDARPLAADAQAVAKLLGEGIDALLRLKHADAERRLDQAIALFEARLTALEDHELLHDALLAKAETQLGAKKRQAALATLQRLAALRPRKQPTAETHKKAFLSLWAEARDSLGTPGRLSIDVAPEGAGLQIDGHALEPGTTSPPPLPPGKHYVVARWPTFTVTRVAQIGPGATLDVELRRDGPAERLREELLGAVGRRRGTDAAGRTAEKIARLANAERVLLAAIRRGDAGFELFLVEHGADGSIRTAGRVAYDGASRDDANVRRLTAALMAAEPGAELEIAPSGAAQPASDVVRRVYGGKSAEAEAPELPAGELPPPPLPDPEPELAVAPTVSSSVAALLALPPVGEDENEGPGWWLWAALALVAAGGATAGAVLLAPGPRSTRLQVELP